VPLTEIGDLEELAKPSDDLEQAVHHAIPNTGSVTLVPLLARRGVTEA
jgi:hypothetical protein